MMETLLLNTLLFLGVVWILLGIVCFCHHFLTFLRHRGKNGKPSVKTPKEKQPDETDMHILVGKSKSFVSASIPEVPAVSPSENPVENPHTFAGQNTLAEQKIPDGTEAEEEADIPIEENEMQVHYTMDEADEDSIAREELQIAGEAMPEVSPTAILATDLARISGWHKDDDTLDMEDKTEVRETLRAIRGTELMEYMKEAATRQEQEHQRLLAAIRKAEDMERQEDGTVSSHGSKYEETDDRPLSYYL